MNKRKVPQTRTRMDEEQIELGASDKFWKLISERRKEKPISRAALEKRIRTRVAARRREK